MTACPLADPLTGEFGRNTGRRPLSRCGTLAEMVRPAFIFAALLACTPGAPATPVEVTPPVVTRSEVVPTVPVMTDCATKVTAMRALFANGPAEMSMIYPVDGMQLPESDRGAPLEDWMPIFIRADGSFEFNGQSFTEITKVNEELAGEFDKAMELGENLGRPWSPRLALVADVRASAAVIRELAGLLPPATQLSMVVNRAGDTIPIAPPIPAAVKAALVIRADVRSQNLAGLLTTATGSCAAVADVFNAVASTTSDLRGKTLFDGLPGAVEKCRCEGVDVETLVAVVWSMGGRSEPDKRQFTLQFARARGPEAVSLSANATVRDLVTLAEARDPRPLSIAPAP